MKRFFKIINLKIIKYFLIPIILIGMWLFLSLAYAFGNTFSFSIISYNESTILNTSVSRLTKGEKINGEFYSHENNLGILSVRFTTLDRVPYLQEDSLKFSLKEKGAKKWYYQNNYRSGLIFDDPLFPFGFPKIANSKGKIYVFEIESLKGDYNNAVGVSNENPVLISRYQIPKQILISNKIEFLNFVLRKITNSIQNLDVIFFSFVYVLPLLFYIFLISPYGTKIRMLISKIINSLIRYMQIPGKQIQGKKIPITITPVGRVMESIISVILGLNLGLIIILSVIFDIFFINISNDIAIIIIMCLWIITILRYKFQSSSTFKVGLLLIFFSFMLFMFNMESKAENSSSWAFMFFGIGLLQSLSEIRLKASKMVK